MGLVRWPAWLALSLPSPAVAAAAAAGRAAAMLCRRFAATADLRLAAPRRFATSTATILPWPWGLSPRNQVPVPRGHIHVARPGAPRSGTQCQSPADSCHDSSSETPSGDMSPALRNRVPSCKPGLRPCASEPGAPGTEFPSQGPRLGTVSILGQALHRPSIRHISYTGPAQTGWQ